MTSDRAVFYDPTRRRWWWFKRLGTLFGLFCVVAVSVWLVSLFSLPLLPGIKGITEPIVRAAKKSIHIQKHQDAMFLFRQKRSRERLLNEIAKERARKNARAAKGPIQAPGIVAAFYAPWQETGLHSLRANASHMTHLLPAWTHLNTAGDDIDFRDWDPNTVPHNNDVLEIARSNNLNVMPVFSNAEMAAFDQARVHKFLTNVQAQNRVIIGLRRWLLANHFQGINVDFENLPHEDWQLYADFLQRMKTSFSQPKLAVSVDLEAHGNSALWRRAASVCDFVIVMAYDENSETSPKPGPIADIAFYRETLQRATTIIPRDKLVIGIANYGYDWQEGAGFGDPVTYQGALLLAQKFRSGDKPEDVVDFDADKLNPTFWYEDDDGKSHEVWFLDAVTAANEWMIAQDFGVRGVGVWVLGSTDPSIWNFIQRQRLTQPVNVGVLHRVSFPYDVEFVGDGEILHVERLPTEGLRSLEVDPNTGLILDEDYHKYPTSFVIQRTGYKPKTIALTIDDGPASAYTAQMLDEFKKYDVKATFFLIGQNAERYPNLVRRIWDEGHEIGNHSYTHPNIGAMSASQARLELTATQRVFQSILHRSTLLFRPPYNADAEPTSLEEVQPVMYASSWNYVVVGEYIDPQDWNTDVLIDGKRHHRTAEEMMQSVLAQLDTEKGSSILLHDGGGDRTETVRLIPMLIEQLRAKGYKFVTVSDLINSTRDEVNPPVKDTDTIMLASDRVVFEGIYIFELFLGIAFLLAIILGAARVGFVTILALVSRWKERRKTFDPAYKPSVSVVIAAFNEEKVIARTIRAVLANHYEPLDVIVVDDGSKDDTSGAVRSEFGDHPHVRLIRQDNGGKASALNHGIAEATGEIIIALDADTIFTRNTISNLVRHFVDPIVGAVAGNVKVGNRINPLTYWQTIEYVTSQNLDRRAYSVINSVTVVPGAVGAWRREAILQAGGYSTDTMAEDMDLTWRIRRIGWRIDNDSDAVGYTEVPDTFGGLFRQRFRWAFGTLQSLWKHRRAIGRYGWFGWMALPSLWLFQIAFQALSPLVDAEILWTVGRVATNYFRAGVLKQDWQPLPQAMTSLYVIGFMYAFFFVVELIGSIVAFKLDREDGRVLVWLFWQRFLYRQLMYAVVLKSIKTAISGIRTGWGKLERKGTVELLPETMQGSAISSSLQP